MTDSRQPTHHGYAVNVKDRTLYDNRGDLSEQEAQAIYEQHQEQFWHDAELIAQEYGFRTVYGEGRMGGWCVPQPQPATDDMWEHELAEWVAKKFRPFEACILDLVHATREVFLEAVEEAKAELELRREACIVRSNN